MFRIIKISENGKFVLSNNMRDLSCTFTMVGYWKQIDDYSLVVNCPNLDSLERNQYSDRKNNSIAGKPKKPIDWKLARENKNNVIPYMIDDTLKFAKDYNSFCINGFEFKKK